MEQYNMLVPLQNKKNRSKNNGGSNKHHHQQQRRYYSSQHNHIYVPPQYSQQGSSAIPNVGHPHFLTYAEPPQQQSKKGSAPKKKHSDDQDLVCSKCARYYQVTKPQQQTFGFNLQRANYTSYQEQQPHEHQELLLRLPYVLPCDHTICGDCIRAAKAQGALKCTECDVCAPIDLDKSLDKSFAINYYLVGRIHLLNHTSSSPMSPDYNNALGDPNLPHFVRGTFPSQGLQQPPYISMQQQSLHGSSYGGVELNCLDIMIRDMGGADQQSTSRCSMGPCKSAAALNCADCKSIFCVACSAVLHGGEIAGLRDHRIRSLQPQLLCSCPKHPVNVLDFHCNICDVDMCCYCFIEGGHAGHDHVRLTELGEEQKIGFKELIKNVEARLKTMEESFKIAEQHINASMDTTASSTVENKHQQQLIASVNKYFADLMAKVLNTHHRLRQKLDTAQNAAVISLRSIQSELAHRLTFGLNLLTQGRMVLDSSNSSKAVFNVAMLQRELEQMLEWHSVLVDGRRDGDKRTGHVEFVSDLSANLDKFCSLKVQDDDQFQLAHEDSIPDGFTVATRPAVGQHDCLDSSSQSSYSENVSSTSRQGDFNKFSKPPSALSVSKMPPVKQNSSAVSGPIVGGRHSVTVVHINNPESMYVQLVDNLPIFKQIHNDLANYVKSLSASEVNNPQMGEYYIVKQNIHWARAKCMRPSKKASFYIVQLLETGQLIEVPKLHLRECSSQFRHVPPMSYHCRLHKVYPITNNWSAESKKLLENILDVKNGYASPFGQKYKTGGIESCNVTMQVLERQNGLYVVQLIASRDGSNTVLSDALMYTGHAKPIDSSNEEIEFKTIDGIKIYDNTSKLDVNHRTRVSIIHVEDPHNIFVHLYNVLSHITDLKRKMNSYYLENNGGLIYTPKKGMFVSIQYAENQINNWYRGIIVNVTVGTGRIDVLLTDFGKIVNVNYKSLRTLPQQFTVLESQAVRIRLADIAPPDSPLSDLIGSGGIWPESTMEFLREFIKQPGHHLEIAPTERSAASGQQRAHTVLLFECLPVVHYCINAQLVEAGLARSTGKFSLLDNISWPQGGAAASIDGNSSDDCRSVQCDLSKRRGGAAAAAISMVTTVSAPAKRDSLNPAMRMMEGTHSFNLDFINTLQMSRSDTFGDGEEKEEDEDDDDEEESAAGMGRVEVEILLVKSPDEMYVKIKSRDVQVAQIEPTLMRRLQLHYADGAAESERCRNESVWQKGDNIVAYNNQTSQYHRGLILHVFGDDVNDGYIVMCRDRAIEFKAEHKCIYPLHEDFVQVPYLSKRICLANIQPMNKRLDQWPMFATDIISNMCNVGNSDIAIHTADAAASDDQKYYFRKVGGVRITGTDVEITTQPGILWVCTLKSCGPLERNRYQYRSINKQLIRAGVAISDQHNHPGILRRHNINTPTPITVEQQQQQEEDEGATAAIRRQPTPPPLKLTPSHTSKAVMRAFTEMKEESDGALSSSDLWRGGEDGEIKSPPPITSYLAAIPLPERRFTAEATYVDETAHIYVRPKQLMPIQTKVDVSVQEAVRMYHQKILLPTTTKSAAAAQSKRTRTYRMGELCTVRFHMDKKWYRGKITNVIPCNTEEFGFEYRVQMADYGNVEQVKPSELIALVLCPTVPLLATRIRMHQVEPKCGPWNTSILDTIHSLIVAKTVDVQICDRQQQLYTISPEAILRIDGLNINDYLLKEFDCLCRGEDAAKKQSNDDDDDDVVIIEEVSPSPTPEEEKSQSVFFSFDDLELMPELEVGHKRIVKVLDVIKINVVTVDMVPDNIQYLRSKYNEVFRSLNDPALPHVPLNDVRPAVNCIARFSADGLYYRAEILSLHPSTTDCSDVSAHVFFIDYGNREVVSCDHLRSLSPYDPLVRRLPAMTRIVALHSVRVPPSATSGIAATPPTTAQDIKVLETLTQLLETKEFNMEIVRSGAKLSVNLLDPKTDQLVYKNLISEGLISYVGNDDSDDDYD